MTKDHITDWIKEIVKVIPELEPKNLCILIDGFVTGEVVYDNRTGVLNIFKGLKDLHLMPPRESELSDSMKRRMGILPKL